jgi:C1A family cysteine protease
LIRNSWGPGWGERGHGWLPYSYILERLAADFWTLVNPQWLASGEFDRPA